MPHITVEYTSGLANELDVDRLVETLHDSAQDLGIFPQWGVRVLATVAGHSRVGATEGADYVQVRVKIARGRPLEVRTHITRALFARLDEAVSPLAAQRPVGYQLEVFEFDTDTALSGGSIPGAPTAP